MEETVMFDNHDVHYNQKITLQRRKSIDNQTIGYYRGYSRLNPGVHFIKMENSNHMSWFKLKHIKELHMTIDVKDN